MVLVLCFGADVSSQIAPFEGAIWHNFFIIAKFPPKIMKIGQK